MEKDEYWKFKKALEQNLRVQIKPHNGYWMNHQNFIWTLPVSDYRIHPDDEHKFVDPTKPKEKFVYILCDRQTTYFEVYESQEDANVKRFSKSNPSYWYVQVEPIRFLGD